MELYESLPLNLRSCYKEGISPIVRSQLDFLWRGAHAAVSSSALAHSLARKFMELGMKSGLHIPELVRNRLCSWCSAVLLPTITSSVRVQPRGSGSKIHKKMNLIPRGETNGDPDSTVTFDTKTRRKLKNQVVTKCSFCTHISSVVSGCERVPPPLKNISSKSISSIKFCEEIDDTLTDNKTIDYEDQNAKKKFSFLQKSSRRSSAPGRIGIEDFIPLGDSNPAPKSGFSFFQKAKNASLNNNNINKNNGGSNSNDIPINAALSLKLGIVNLEEEGSEKVILTGIKRPLNLLELEQMNKKEKKNRRKTLDQNSKNTATPNRSNASSINSRIPNVGFEINTKGSASLSSLQNMFMKK